MPNRERGNMSDQIHIERTGRTATVSFDTGSTSNALSQSLIRNLTEVAREFRAAPDISTVILTGRPDNFSMGADLKDPDRARLASAGLGERRIIQRLGPDLCEAWERVDAMTICAIEGWCIGGGMALAAACDLRVSSETATFYVPEVERGMNMSWGAIPRFVALIGPARTKRLAALCEKVSAEQAIQWGLVDYSSVPGGAVKRAQQIAEEAADLPPTALKMVKQDVNVSAFSLARATAHRDLEAFLLMQESDDFKEGVAAFLEGRSPRFTGD